MRSLAKRFGTATLGLLVAIVALEIVLRAMLSVEDHASHVPPATPSEAGQWTDHPFFPFIGQPEAEYIVTGNQWGNPVEGRIKNNSLGFRTHELPNNKPPGAYFVVTLGGSTTWGALAPSNEYTWPALLEQKLQRHYPDREVRVFNLGTQNATVPYSVTALALMASMLEPDLTIVYQAFNDFGPSVAMGYRPDHAHYFRDLGLGQRWEGIQRSLPKWIFSSYAVAYVTSLADRLIGANNLSFYVDRPVMRDLAVLTRASAIKTALMRNWRHFLTIDALTRGFGGRALFSTFQFFDGGDRQNRLVNESLRAFFAQHSLAYVDQDLLIADGDEGLQFDECHFTNAGRELVAENFFSEIVARAWLESPTTKQEAAGG